MKFKAIASPKPAKGQGEFPPSITTPDQSMSLEEILERFTRGEPVAIGRDAKYHDSDDDLEKIQTMDLVDREEYVERLKHTQETFKKQDKARKAAEEKRLENEAIARIQAQKEQEKKGDSPDSGKVIP